MQKIISMIKFSIECWLYNDIENRFLLLRCPVTHRHDEYWQPVTGGRNPEEPCIEACLREVAEETGVVLSREHVEIVIPEFTFCIPEARIELRKPIYLARVRNDKVVLSSEHIGYYWFDAGDVEAHLHWDSNKESYRSVLAYIRS
jgi:dATP pyrophosphohydrolase